MLFRSGIPYLIAHLHELPPATCVDVVHALEKRRNRAESVTGRSFNLARWRAATALRQLPAVAIASAAPLARSSSPGGTPPDAAGIGCPASN